MIFKFKNLTDLLLTFNTEEKCIAYFEQQRWKGHICCPKCGHDKVYRVKSTKGYKCANPKCYKMFSVTVGTYLENSNIKLQKWFAAIYLFGAHKKGVSSCQLARDLGITQRSAWFMLHRIRKIFTPKKDLSLTGTVEADETFIGGRIKNKHKAVRQAIVNSSSHVHKAPVIGFIQRKGSLVVHAVKIADKATILPILRDTIPPGATVYTDSAHMYKTLGKDYTHEVINHEQDEYVKGDIHTNTIEGFFGQMKRGIYGIYHHASGKHLDNYCQEFAYRYNTRGITDNSRFDLSLTQTKGRLKYSQLIAK